jgi:cobalamin biosynthesis Mg chelatase CobN
MPILDLVEHHRPHIPERSTAAILSATISGDDRRLEALVDSLAARGVRVLLLFIDDSSFLAIDRPALSRQQAAERRARLETLMREHGVPGAILGGESDLATELGRPDLFFS